MRLVMTLSVRNEADTIEDFVRYHLAVGVDGILVSDRGSSDGTLGILDRLSSQLPLAVLEHSLEAGAGGSADERLSRFAADRLEAQWIIDGSIGEFWLTDGSDLLDGGEPVPADVSEILVGTTAFLSRTPTEGWSTLRENTDESSEVRRIRRVAGGADRSIRLPSQRAVVGLVPAPSHEVLVQRAITSGMESDLGMAGELGASAAWASLFSSWLDGALDVDAAQHTVDPVEAVAGLADGSMVDDDRIVDVLGSADDHLSDLAPIPLAPPAVDTRSDGFILVAGMHRSGTSAVARVINLLGADIGDAAALMEAKPDNPSGFWENQAFAAVDDDVIALLGGRWDDIPSRAIDWPFDPRFDEVRNRAREVAQGFSDAPKRVVKDPRLSITLPFWRGVIPIAGVVLPIRHPMEVAGSLRSRDDMDQEAAGELWCAYVESTLAADPGCAVVDYDRLVADPVGTASVLADALGLPRPSDSTADAIRGFLDPSLRHHEQRRPERTIGRRMREAIAMYDALLTDDRWEAMTIASARIDAVRLDSARQRLLRMEHEWALARVHAAELIRERDHVWKLRDEADAKATDLVNRNRLQNDELAQLEAVNRRLLGKSAHQTAHRTDPVPTERVLDKLQRRMRSRRPGEG